MQTARFLRVDLLDFEEPFRVVIAKLIPKLIAALGNRAHAAPFAVADLKDFVDQVLGDAIAVALRPRAGTGFPLPPRPSSSWRTVIKTPSRISRGSNPVITMGTWKRSAIGSYSL